MFLKLLFGLVIQNKAGKAYSIVKLILAGTFEGLTFVIAVPILKIHHL